MHLSLLLMEGWDYLSSVLLSQDVNRPQEIFSLFVMAVNVRDVPMFESVRYFYYHTNRQGP